MKVLVLGGYGNFGRLIARALSNASGISVIVAGRDEVKARRTAEELRCGWARIDANEGALADRIVACDANLVISTVGPFQGQDYRVAQAAIDAGAHYVDIADGRDFVSGIGVLDEAARARGVLVVAGASSVPALTSAVIDQQRDDFANLRSIDIGICTSSRIPGEATVRAILGYCGKPFAQWRDGAPALTRGWQGLRHHRFRQAPMKRWLCDCDVPDLALFPSRYPGVRDVRFGAGLQPTLVHLGLWALATAVRVGILPGLAPASTVLARTARRLEGLGSDRSAMFVRLSGIGRNGRELERTWELVAGRHEGANIPCMAAVSFARKLAAGSISRRGAFPCVGFVTLDEYLEELRPFDVSWGRFDEPGPGFK